MEDEIQCHGQLDGGIWLLLYWGWCKCRYKKQTVASLLQLVLALLGRCAMWVCGKLECLLLLRSASSSENPTYSPPHATHKHKKIMIMIDNHHINGALSKCL